MRRDLGARGYPAAARAAGQGAGRTSWGGRERGGACLPASLRRVTGLVNPLLPFLTPFHLFPLDSLGVRSNHRCRERPLCPPCNVFLRKVLLVQRELALWGQWSGSWERPRDLHFSGGPPHLRGRRGLRDTWMSLVSEGLRGFLVIV